METTSTAASVACSQRGDCSRQRFRQRNVDQEYRNRASQIHLLDRRHMAALAAAPVGDQLGTQFLLSGCLDALEHIPAGSTVVTIDRFGELPGCYDQQMLAR